MQSNNDVRDTSGKANNRKAQQKGNVIESFRMIAAAFVNSPKPMRQAGIHDINGGSQINFAEARSRRHYLIGRKYENTISNQMEIESEE